MVGAEWEVAEREGWGRGKERVREKTGGVVAI